MEYDEGRYKETPTHIKRLFQRSANSRARSKATLEQYREGCDERKKIKRRVFLKLSGLVAAGLAVFGGFKLLKDDLFNQKSSPSKTLSQSAARGDINVQLQKTNVFVHASKQDHDMEGAVITAAQATTDFCWLKTGQVVFIKTVNNSGFSYPSTTSPIAVSAMIKLLKQKGAGKVIVGDMSGIEHLKFFKDKTIGSTLELMKASGMLQAIEVAGGEPMFFEESGWSFPQGTNSLPLLDLITVIFMHHPRVW